MANTKRQDKAWRRAMANCIDKGRNPVAEIDGYIQFMVNHFDGMPMTDKQRKAMDATLRTMRSANTVIDAIQKDLGTKPYYEANRD